MINIAVVNLLIITHLIADFVLQSNWMATNKSKNWKALLAHTSTYGTVMLVTALVMISQPKLLIIYWGLFNFVAHTATDFVTSKITSKLWAKQDWHNFFVVIGIDQTIHYLTLIISYYYMVQS